MTDDYDSDDGPREPKLKLAVEALNGIGYRVVQSTDGQFLVYLKPKTGYGPQVRPYDPERSVGHALSALAAAGRYEFSRGIVRDAVAILVSRVEEGRRLQVHVRVAPTTTRSTSTWPTPRRRSSRSPRPGGR